MTILFIAAIVTVPVVIGDAALRVCLMKGKKPAVWEGYIIGTLICILLGEVLHLCTVFLHWPFRRFFLSYAIALVAVVAASAVATIVEKRKNHNQNGKTSIRGNQKKNAYLWVLALCAIILFQCIFHIVMHVPDVQWDVTIENVTTMLHTDTVYQLNPLTGQSYEVGMPMRLKILALPSIYAACCKWFHVNPQVVVYNLVPIFVLILSYLVLFGWARYLYPEKEKQQRNFMLFAALLLQFGNYAVMTLGYGLFHMGFRGEVICAGILYPYILLMCLQKRKWSVLLCLIVEIGMVWTWYGLGGGLLICMVTLFSCFLSKAVKERRKAV